MPLPPLRTTRLILLALAGGTLTFTGVVVFLRLTGSAPANPELGRMLLLVLLALSASEAGAYVVLRRSLLARARAGKDESLAALKEGRTPAPLHQLAILGAALAEGAGLFGTVALLIGAPWFALAAPLLAVVLILLQLPTREGLQRLVRGV